MQESITASCWSNIKSNNKKRKLNIVKNTNKLKKNLPNHKESMPSRRNNSGKREINIELTTSLIMNICLN